MQPHKDILIDEDGSIAYVVRDWYGKDTQETFESYKALPWVRRQLKMYGQVVHEARFSIICGEEYVFNSGMDGTAYGWDDPRFKEVAETRDRLLERFEFPINNCFLNYYTDGKDNIGYHHDKNLTEPNFVCSVSFGGSRDFLLKRIDSGKVTSTKLHDGDLFVMYGETNNLYKHSVPKRAGSEPRISLTFRNINIK